MRAKEELQLEYSQALLDYQDGTFTFEELDSIEDQQSIDGALKEDTDEVWDLAACAAFKEAFDKRLQEASEAEEEGGLTAERTREIQRQLEQSIDEIEPVSLEGLEEHYLPASWFTGGVDADKKAKWRAKICTRFKDLLVEEIVEVRC